MMPHEPVRDLLRRTMANLKYIEDRSADHGPYEVTQLINSFLAGLAHPWEEYKQELKTRSIDDAIQDGWPELRKERADDVDPEHLGDLLWLVRNSFAHGNIEFQSTGGNRITHLRFWNKNRKGKRTWGTVVPVSYLRRLLEKFAELAETLVEADVARRGA